MDRLLIAIGFVVGLLGMSAVAALRERSASTSPAARPAWRSVRGLALALSTGVMGVLLVFSLLPSAARLLSR